MLNVNQITSQLAKMPDNALQQYATMHKSDPYMLALTIAESNRRKEMRSAAQGAQGAIPQPKVADQAIAGMSPQQLPENVGIGALPADNIKNMATGGIVAFDEGGRVGQQDVQAAYDEWMASQPSWYQQTTPTTAQRVDAAKSRYEQLLQKMQTQPNVSQPGAGAAKPMPAEMPAETARLKAQNTAAQGVPTGLAAAAAAQEKAAPVAPAAVDRSGIAAGVGGAGAANPYKPSTLADMMKEVSPEVEKMNAEDRAAMDPFRKQFEEERADLAKRKETNKGEALLAAGLGMMAGNSRYALQNIGAGGAQGLASLKEATRADDAAKRALMQSEMHLAQAEMQGRKGNFQNMNALANQARQEKQFAVSSELQRQQIAQQGQYYRDMGEAAKARGGMDAKVMTEYTKIQNKATDSVDKDIMAGLLRPEQKEAMILQRTRAMAMDNPLLARFLSMSSEDKEPVTRTLD